MLIVREQFTAKPGNASKLAKMFRGFFGNDSNIRVLTDVVACYNTVVIEMQVKSLAEYEKLIEKHRSGEVNPDIDPKAAEEMSKYTELYLTGRREIYRVVE